MHDALFSFRLLAMDGREIGTCDLLLEHVGYEGDQTRKHLRNLPLLHFAYSAINPVAIKSLMRAVGLPAGDLRRPLRGLEGEALAKGLRIVKELELDKKYGWNSAALQAA